MRRKQAAPDDAPTGKRGWLLIAGWGIGLISAGLVLAFLINNRQPDPVEDDQSPILTSSSRRQQKAQPVANVPVDDEDDPAPNDPPKKPVIRDGDRLVQLDRFDEAKIKGIKVEQLDAALKKKTTLAFNGKPLLDVLKQIAEKHHIPIVVDNAALADEGIPLKKWPVTASVTDTSLAEAFDAVLSPMQLTAILPTPDAKAVIVTSEVKAAGLDANKLLNGSTVASNNPGGTSTAKPSPKPKPTKRPATRKTNTRELVRSGKRLIARRKFDEAIAEFNKALRARGNDIDALYSRGYAYLLKKDNRKAVKDFSSVIRLRRNHRAAYLSRALAFARMGRRESARADRIAANKLGRRKK